MASTLRLALGFYFQWIGVMPRLVIVDAPSGLRLSRRASRLEPGAFAFTRPASLWKVVLAPACASRPHSEPCEVMEQLATNCRTPAPRSKILEHPYVAVRGLTLVRQVLAIERWDRVKQRFAGAIAKEQPHLARQRHIKQVEGIR